MSVVTEFSETTVHVYTTSSSSTGGDATSVRRVRGSPRRCFRDEDPANCIDDRGTRRLAPTTLPHHVVAVLVRSEFYCSWTFSALMATYKSSIRWKPFCFGFCRRSSGLRTFNDGIPSADLKTPTRASPHPPSAVVTRRLTLYMDPSSRSSLGITTMISFIAVACWFAGTMRSWFKQWSASYSSRHMYYTACAWEECQNHSRWTSRYSDGCMYMCGRLLTSMLDVRVTIDIVYQMTPHSPDPYSLQ